MFTWIVNEMASRFGLLFGGTQTIREWLFAARPRLEGRVFELVESLGMIYERQQYDRDHGLGSGEAKNLVDRLKEFFR